MPSLLLYALDYTPIITSITILTEVNDDSCCVISPNRVQLNCSISETTPIAAAASEGTRRRKVVKGESTATKLGPEERGDIWCVEGGCVWRVDGQVGICYT